DGLANATNSTTSVITTGVAPRIAAPSTFLDSDVSTLVLSRNGSAAVNAISIPRKTAGSLSRWWKRG
ncbi:MAG TPA: hypothetical protein VFG20_15590, partial [Planctomycetaceae bacterium]|nr:hypothetical protein [Planctomycetaceae bacterium]